MYICLTHGCQKNWQRLILCALAAPAMFQTPTDIQVILTRSTYLRYKGWIADRVKGNQWLISPDHKAMSVDWLAISLGGLFFGAKTKGKNMIH